MFEFMFFFIFVFFADIKVLEFKPSIVAASSLLYASHELFPFQYPGFMGTISDCSYVNKVQILSLFSFLIFLHELSLAK
jgi:cyclin D6